MSNDNSRAGGGRRGAPRGTIIIKRVAAKRKICVHVRGNCMSSHVNRTPPVIQSMSQKKSVSTPGTGKKDSKKKGNASKDERDAGDAQSEGFVRLNAVYQSRSSENTELLANMCLLSASTLKALQVSPGALVAVRGESGDAQVLCRAWPNRRSAQTGSDHALLHRLWQNSFEEGGSKKVVVQALKASNLRLLPCKSLVLLCEARPELKGSVELRQLLQEMLRDCVLRGPLRLSLSLRGRPLSLLVQHALPVNGSGSSETTKEGESALRITAHTEIVVVASAEEAQPYLGLERALSHTDAQSESNTDTQPRFAGAALNADALLARVRESFVGCEKEARLALGIACLGLGFLDTSVRAHTTQTTTTTYTEETTPTPTMPSSSSSYAQTEVSLAEPTSSDVHTEAEKASSVSVPVPARSVSRPKGLLVFGSPGTGKSALVCSIVRALGVNVVVIDHKILLSQFQGAAEQELTRKFFEAKSLSPCCIVMENMELLCPSRAASTASDLQKRLVACYLSLVDALHDSPSSHTDPTNAHKNREGESRVFILATSTRPLDIDAAARRAGRIDREIELSAPSATERAALLRFLCEKNGVRVLRDGSDESNNTIPAVPVSASSRLFVREKVLCEAAQRAHGMVPSDLLQVLKEACYTHSVRTLTSHTASTQHNEVVPSKGSPSPSQNDEDSLLCELTQSLASLSVAAPEPSNTQEDTRADSVIAEEELSEATLLAAVQRVSPSALREVVVEVPAVRWTDIGGMHTVKRALRQVVEYPLTHPQRFAQLGITPLKGVLLYGPPGCSKTLMAKAVATESSMNFLAVRGPELLSKWLGESEKAVQSLFRKARAAAPSIVFFDEIDALAGVRGESSAGVSDRVLSQLLTELDGIRSLKQVIVIAATNRPDMLDPALIRPGRIDRKIYVPPPDDESRESILRLELKKLPLSGAVDVAELVRKTQGFSGAEVVAVCNEAALFAIDRDADAVSQDDLMTAASKIKPQITPEMLFFYTTFAAKNK